jgi:hypothetical protein
MQRRIPLVVGLGGCAVAAAGLVARWAYGRYVVSKLNSLHPIILSNSEGLIVHITRVGASIQRLYVQDRDGKQLDVVLGFEHPSTYAVGAAVPTLQYQQANDTRGCVTPC